MRSGVAPFPLIFFFRNSVEQLKLASAMEAERARKLAGLREFIANKRICERPLTPAERALGFLGWHERGVLPHCDYPGLTQFLTIRLADSMPSQRRGEWEHLLRIPSCRERRTKLEEYLDKGIGSCALKESVLDRLVETAILHFHRSRYELIAWCVMPNHVHLLVKIWDTPVWKLVQSWKRFTVRQSASVEGVHFDPPSGGCAANAQTSQSRLRLQWQREYWDTFMRDDNQSVRAVQYIERNPVVARLCATVEQWPFSSARHRDRFQKLELPASLTIHPRQLS